MSKWAEFDCPDCGIDYDFEPPPVPGGELPRCPCGHQYTDADMRDGNFYDDDVEGRILANPFALIRWQMLDQEWVSIYNPHTGETTKEER